MAICQNYSPCMLSTSRVGAIIYYFHAVLSLPYLLSHQKYASSLGLQRSLLLLDITQWCLIERIIAILMLIFSALYQKQTLHCNFKHHHLRLQHLKILHTVFKDLQRLSKFISICCSKKQQCPEVSTEEVTLLLKGKTHMKALQNCQSEAQS